MKVITQHTNIRIAREHNFKLYRILNAVVHKVHGIFSKYNLEL